MDVVHKGSHFDGTGSWTWSTERVLRPGVYVLHYFTVVCLVTGPLNGSEQCFIENMTATLRIIYVP